MTRARILLLLAGMVGGCAGGNQICADAQAHVAACAGEEVASTLSTCDPAAAEEVLKTDCAALTDAKADNFITRALCRVGRLSSCEAFAPETGLESMIGAGWRLVEAKRDEYILRGVGCAPTLSLVATKSGEGAPKIDVMYDHPEHGLGLAYDRAPFLAINEGKQCEDVDQSLVEDLNICHDTVVTAVGSVRHSVKLSQRYGFLVHFIPAGSQTATQTLTLEGSRLAYEYRIDDELYDRCVYERAAAAN